MPGIMLFAIPPIVTAITGAVSLPWIYWWMTRRVLDERATLATMAA